MSGIPKSEVSRHHQKVQSWCHTVDSWWKKPCASWHGSLGVLYIQTVGFLPRFLNQRLVSFQSQPLLPWVSPTPGKDGFLWPYELLLVLMWGQDLGLQGFSGGFPELFTMTMTQVMTPSANNAQLRGKSLKITPTCAFFDFSPPND